MNQILESVNPEEVLFFDIETARGQKEIKEGETVFDLFRYKHRNRDTMELPSVEDTVTLYNDTAALYPMYGKIVTISVGFIKGNKCYYKAITGEESAIIEEFASIINKGNYKLSGFNILRFDVPYVRIRAAASRAKAKLSNRVTDSGRKPWELEKEIIDTMDILKGTYYNPMSLAEACYLYDIPTPKDDISGSQVSEVYYTEGVDRIATYCNKDVVASIQLFFALRGEECPIVEWIDRTNATPAAAPVTKEEPKEETKEKPLITRIMLLGSISGLEEEILEGAKKLKTKKDKTKYVQLIQTALQKSEFSLEEEEVFTKILS